MAPRRARCHRDLLGRNRGFQRGARTEDRLEIELSFAGAVRKALPSVVSIYARRVVRERLSVFDSNPFFREFFGNMFPESTRRRMQNSLGSGILAHPDGIVITADHVIRGAEEVRVVLADRREYSAAILLSDSVSDLAVLQLEDVREDLPALEVRDADELEIGDFVLAIGNPLGVGQTVTSGIVSALARSNGEERISSRPTPRSMWAIPGVP